MSTHRTITLLLGACFLISSSGCANTHRWGMPWGQGTAVQQQARAVTHDPFPLNDIGPAVTGGRPREFYHPQPEAVRDQFAPSQPPANYGYRP